MTERAETVLFAAATLEWVKPLRILLERAGIRVLQAGSTSEALTEAREAAPDIVIIDKDLEPLTISSVIEDLRKCPSAPEIVLLSSEWEQHRDEQQRSLGLIYHAVKPVDAFRLFDIITFGLKRRRQSSTPAHHRPALILCVDDDSLYLQSLCRVLTRHGYRVFLCNSAERAMATLPEVRPDLAIVDVMMPGTDGLALTESIHAWSKGRIPVVLLSALSTDEVYFEGHARGARSFLSKPCPEEEVLRVVDSLLEAPSLSGPEPSDN